MFFSLKRNFYYFTLKYFKPFNGGSVQVLFIVFGSWKWARSFKPQNADPGKPRLYWGFSPALGCGGWKDRKLRCWLWHGLGLHDRLLLLACLFLYDFETLEGIVCKNVEGYCSRDIKVLVTVPLRPGRWKGFGFSNSA